MVMRNGTNGWARSLNKMSFRTHDHFSLSFVSFMRVVAVKAVHFIFIPY